MSGTSTNRSRGHRSVGVGDSDLEAVKRLHRRRALRPRTKAVFLCRTEVETTKK
ncbi:MAG: hypothetical protein K2O61_04890 [Bacteroidaceae bacterium]|nr:hypothetical protein [Bacteroidaceae bacterium]